MSRIWVHPGSGLVRSPLSQVEAVIVVVKLNPLVSVEFDLIHVKLPATYMFVVRIPDDEAACDRRVTSGELVEGEVAEEVRVWVAHPEFEVQFIICYVVCQIVDHGFVALKRRDGDAILEHRLERVRVFGFV